MKNGRIWALLVLVLLCGCVSGASASAAVPPFLGQTPEDGVRGSGAGQLDQPFGIAVNPVNGHLFVAENKNHRISESTAWGEFVKAFGWGVADGSSELQVCTETCQAGKPGSGPGQLDSPGGAVADADGNVYVVDVGNLRVQKFSPDGHFLLMFGYEVNATTGADVCTAADVAAGDQCGPGQEGTAPTQFSKWVFYNDGRALAISPSGDVYVGEENRIQVFGPDGAFKEAVNFSEVPGLPSGIAKSIAIGPDGTLYLAYFQAYAAEQPTIPDVYAVDPAARQLLGKINVGFAKLLAVDADGNLYVSVLRRDPVQEEIQAFDGSGECIICPGEDFGRVDSFFVTQIDSIATSNACGPTDLYAGLGDPLFHLPETERSQISIYGPPPDTSLCPPPVKPPTILSEYATSVGSETARLGAEINPRYWNDTTYYLEYGSEDCATSSCQKKPLSPQLLSDKTVNGALKTAPVQLEGLQPDTTYHYRFVAESSGGGPVFGPDRSFTTKAPPEAPPNPDSCANAAFRTGPSASLPDCRAYELVSPLEKGGGSILTLGNVYGYSAAMNQSAEAGGKLTYSAVGAFGEPQSAPYASQYIAERTSGGWENHSISPPRNAPIFERGFTTDAEFKAFTPDLCLSWLRHDSDPPLAPGVPAGFANLYRADQCGGGEYEALPTQAPSVTPRSYEPELQGFSTDGSHSIFVADAALGPEAPQTDDSKLYESVGEGEPRFVCILPDETSVTESCSAGSRNPSAGGFGRSDSVENAISADGSRIFWSPDGGAIYMRGGGAETLGVSQPAEEKSKAKGKGAFYLNATPSGSKVLFETNGNSAKSIAPDLYTYDLESEETTLIAKRSGGIMGSSEDLSRVYFVSEEALAPGAAADQPNLYLYEAGEPPAYTFIGVLSAEDAAPATLQQIPSPVNREPVKHTSRVTPDGATLAFMATASLTGYENFDRESGEPDAEVYLYRVSEGLHCVSCDPTGARPAGRELSIGGFTTGLWAAAKISPWLNQLYAPRVLSEDGDRLYFESYQQLAPTDNDEAQDVYQWEAPGSGSCTAGKGDYVPSAGGCVSAISSGPDPAEFVDASADGTDAFLATVSSLVSSDYGLRDIYDARVGGGFPPPPAPKEECQGAACQSPPAPPALPTPSSSSYSGLPEAKKPRPCPKGKRVVRKGGKVRCGPRARHNNHRHQSKTKHQNQTRRSIK